MYICVHAITRMYLKIGIDIYMHLYTSGSYTCKWGYKRSLASYFSCKTQVQDPDIHICMFIHTSRKHTYSLTFIYTHITYIHTCACIRAHKHTCDTCTCTLHICIHKCVNIPSSNTYPCFPFPFHFRLCIRRYIYTCVYIYMHVY